MLNAVKTQLSSIKVKLFLWFWLVTICSIVATRLVSTQLSQEYVQTEVDTKDIRKLNMLKARLEKIQPQDLEAFIGKFRDKKRSSFNNRQVVFKPLNGDAIIADFNPHRFDIERFIGEEDFEAQQTWIFRFFKITGPVNLTIRGEQYQMFYQSRGKRPRDLRELFSELPLWARIGTPLIISIIFCWLLARSISRPLSNISNVAQSLGKGDLSMRVEKDDKRSDELGSLAKVFNQMAEKLAANVSAHQRLLGDVSHELRSPLTRLQIALALAEKNKDNPELLSDYIARGELEISRLDTMIEHVLVLSRLENSTQKLEKQPCHMAAMLETLVDDGTFLGQNKKVEVKLNVAADPEVDIDQALVMSAISNIINNAVNHTPESTNVTVSLTEDSSDVIVVIADQGPGVPDTLLPRLFEPFYRVADARDRVTGGTGLGLAIAKQAILAHQGNIIARNLDKGGLEVSIKLPK
ncbi:MAG: two-component sensor histidine kinase [Colwelliaceae bacterium]|nr:two-component sensor histidine kinase [Colwelliaceae bacterium]